MDLIQKVNEDINNNLIGRKLLYNEIEIDNNIVFLLNKLKKIKINKENKDLFCLLLYFNELDLNNIEKKHINIILNNINFSYIKNEKYLYKLLEINETLNENLNKNKISYNIEKQIRDLFNKQLKEKKIDEALFKEKIFELLEYSKKYKLLYKNSNKDSNFFNFFQNKEKLILNNNKNDKDLFYYITYFIDVSEVDIDKLNEIFLDDYIIFVIENLNKMNEFNDISKILILKKLFKNEKIYIN